MLKKISNKILMIVLMQGFFLGSVKAAIDWDDRQLQSGIFTASIVTSLFLFDQIKQRARVNSAWLFGTGAVVSFAGAALFAHRGYDIPGIICVGFCLACLPAMAGTE